MATRKITPQEQEIADLTGGRYRTDLPGGGVAMNHRPPTGGSTYVSKEENMSGAGRGGQGGPTAKELKKYEDKQDADIYTANKGKPPTDPEMAKKQGGMIKKMASGGSVFRSSANGIAQRGKTRGTMVKMNSGGKC
jgi:hypothetical protein